MLCNACRTVGFMCEKGYSTMEQVKDQLTAELRRDKKAAMLMEKMKGS